MFSFIHSVKHESHSSHKKNLETFNILDKSSHALRFYLLAYLLHFTIPYFRKILHNNQPIPIRHALVDFPLLLHTIK